MAQPYTYYNTDRDSINNSGTSIFTLAVSYTSTSMPNQTFVLIKTLTPVQTSALALIFTSTPGLPKKYRNKNLQKITKLALNYLSKVKSMNNFKQSPHPSSGP